MLVQKTILFSLTLVLSSFSFAQNAYHKNNKTFGSYKIIDKRDTLIIVDTLKNKTLKTAISEFRYGNFLNEYGLIFAKISDGEGLLNKKGQMLNGPYGSGTTYYLPNGYILTGVCWRFAGFSDPRCLGQIIFNAKGDTILYGQLKYQFFYSQSQYTDTTLVEGFNGKTKRQEKGFLLKTGHWQTKEYLDKNGIWQIKTK